MKTKLLALPLILAGILCAQPPAGRTPPTPAEMVNRRVQMLTKFLNLDAGQQTQVNTILTNEQNSLAPFASTLRDDRSKLIAAIKANDQASISSISNDIANIESQENVIRANAAAQIYALLNADQKNKLGDNLGILIGGPGMGMGPAMGMGRGPRR